MRKHTEGNHMQSVKNLNKHMENLIIQVFPNKGSEMGKGAGTGDMIHTDPGIASIAPSPLLIMKGVQKLLHRLIPNDVSKKVQQKQTHRIIRRLTAGSIAMCNQRAHKGKINQRGNHPGISALNGTIRADIYKPFFKPVVGKQGSMRKGPIMRKRDFKVDFIQIFDNITYGKFFKRVYHIWFGQKGQLLPRLTPQLFSKVFPQRIKKNIFNGTVGKMRVSPLGGTSSLSHAGPIARFIAGSFEAVLFNESLKHV